VFALSQDASESQPRQSAQEGTSGLLSTLRAQISRGDRIVYAVVASLILLALLVQPLWGLLQPGVALGHDYLERGSKRGPWGHPWVEEAQADLTYAPLQVWSVGPNGVDERGRGDDVVLRLGSLATLYGSSTEWVLLLAGLVAGLWELRRVVRSQLRKPQAPTPGPEMLRAAGLAIPPGIVLGVVGVAALRVAEARAPDTLEVLTDALWVPPWVAAVGCAYLASAGLILWYRLSRAPASDGSA
jgi:hypothetical protein